MGMEKKLYNKPQTDVVRINVTNNILQTSSIPGFDDAIGQINCMDNTVHTV